MNDCCEPKTPGDMHLAIIGGGSAAFSAAIKASDLGSRVTLINDRLPIGGTCVNVGCVPSKTLLRAAEALHRAQRTSFAGLSVHGSITDFSALIEQKRGLVHELRQKKYIDLAAGLPNVRLLSGRASLVDARTIAVNGEVITADRIILATGAAPAVPAIPGLSEVGFLTNETLFELTTLPESLIVLGAGYVGLESAQMFSRFGSRVRVIQRGAQVLSGEDRDVADAIAAFLREEGLDVITSSTVRAVRRLGDHRVAVEVEFGGRLQTYEAEHVLVATGRTPNTSDMGLDAAGITREDSGFIHVDRTLQTSVTGVFAAGDVIGTPMYVYVAAYEGALAAENALTGAGKPSDYTALPWVVFTDPQVAGVGLSEAQAAATGVHAEALVVPLSEVPRAIAARDMRGFIKLVRNRDTDRIIGARIVAPEGSELLMEVSLAIRYGATTQELSSWFHPYLTLSEGVKLAATGFHKDLKKLSCCAA